MSGTSDPDFFWAIDLSDDMTNFALRFISTGENTTLNAHGVYELPPIETPGMPTTLRLLINDTARNNGTVINCGSVTSARSTTMFVLGINVCGCHLFSSFTVIYTNSFDSSYTGGNEDW